MKSIPTLNQRLGRTGPGRWDGRKNSNARGYDYRWRKLRQVHIASEPLCRHCSYRGVITPATEVDHIKPFDSKPELRLDPNNLQSLCRACHATKTHQDHREGG